MSTRGSKVTGPIHQLTNFSREVPFVSIAIFKMVYGAGRTKSLRLSGKVPGLCQDSFKDVGTFLSLMEPVCSHQTLNNIQIVWFTYSMLRKHTRVTQGQHLFKMATVSSSWVSICNTCKLSAVEVIPKFSHQQVPIFMFILK